jgi:type IV pilus assembly protein PilE
MTIAAPPRLSPVPRRSVGFTLIEVMVTVAIVGILAAVALPMYGNYVIRGKLVAMTNALAAMRTAMEQYYQDNRTYLTTTSGTTTITSPCDDTTNYAKTWNNAYTLSCSAKTSTTYTLLVLSTTSAVTSGASYTVDQANNMVTTSFPTNWGALPSNTSCWLMRKGDSC